jgi:hypothetical protein
MRPIAALLLAMAGLLPAAPVRASEYPRFTPSSWVFADYRGSLGGPQSFNVTRAFLTLRGELDATWSSQVTLNAVPLVAAREAHNEVLQQAYLQAAHWVPHTTLQLGLINTPWVEYEYAYWRYRMLGTVGVEGGLANSLGLGATGALTLWDKGLKATTVLGPVTVAGALLNGEGFRANEGDGQKAFQGRVTYQPWPWLDLALAGHRGNPTGALQADRLGAMATYHAAPLLAGTQAVGTFDVDSAGAATSGRVLSAWAVYDLAPVQLIGRVHHFTGTNDRLELLAGLGWQPTKGVDLVLDDQHVMGAWESNTLALHTALQF